ncbi:MAG: hypothetical protein KKF30_02270 [Proteobacteria bacterium]|nr:hypothetical protein [Pseudomonadota bacterium]MBU4471572.1 hypothetical protein [Pseudomonadota bacterium]MCG2752578.1 hypothetical protein [Desulfobacteraceae bacterium]
MVERNTVIINTNIEISGQALETIVDTAKKITGRNSKGYYRIDSADLVSRMISRFLVDNDFESYVQDSSKYALPHPVNKV